MGKEDKKERKEKKAKKSSKEEKHSKKDKKHDKNEKEDKHESNDKLIDNPISSEDFFFKNEEFRVWLRLEKQKYGFFVLFFLFYLI